MEESISEDAKALGLLQRHFNALLAAYLNSGSLPLDIIRREADQYRAVRVNGQAASGANANGDFSETATLFLKSANEGKVPELIRQMYWDYKNVMENESARHAIETKTFSIGQPFNYDKVRTISPKYDIIRHLQKKLSAHVPFFDSVLVHGSFATRDFVETWSDLDVLVILGDGAFASAQAVRELKGVLRRNRYHFYAVDPLAHHFFQIMTAVDFHYYAESFLPEAVYVHAARLFGKDGYDVSLRDGRADIKKILQRLSRHFEKRLRDPARNIYELKHDISHILLLPVLFLESEGIYMYKRESFSAAEKRFDLDFEPVRKASALRAEWKTPHVSAWFKGAVSFPVVANVAFTALSRAIRKQRFSRPTKKEYNALISETKKLIDNFMHL